MSERLGIRSREVKQLVLPVPREEEFGDRASRREPATPAHRLRPGDERCPELRDWGQFVGAGRPRGDELVLPEPDPGERAEAQEIGVAGVRLGGGRLGQLEQ